jgi:hypothetical protein
MATDPNSEPYEKGKPNPIDLIGDLSPMAQLAYVHHMMLACGESWTAFVGLASQDGDEAPEWMVDVPRAISVMADGWTEILTTVGVNWMTATGEINAETATSDTAGS